MAVLAFVLVVSAVGVAVWRWQARRGPTTPTGTLASLVDHGRDLLAPLFPSRPLSRRALPRRLLRAAEQTVTIGVSGMILVPTRIEIAVNPDDLEPFTDAMEWLRRDVGEALRQRAVENGWVVPDGPEVVITPDEERPVRLPRAVGRIGAFSPDQVHTRRRPGPPPDAVPNPPARPAPNGRGNAPAPVAPNAPAGGSPGVAGSPAEGLGTDAAAAAGAGEWSPGAETRHAPGTAAFPPAVPAEPTPMTSVVIGGEQADADVDLPTEAVAHAVHLRLVSLAEHTGDGGDLNVLLVSSANPLVVGRSREADIQLKDRQISARHCTFSVDPEGQTVTVEDLRSTNGTFVDGYRIDRAPLEPGATVRIGNGSWRVAIDPVTSR